MKRALATIFATAAIGALGSVALANTQIPLDKDHTSATFTVAHLTITKVSGQIPLISSTVTVDDKGLPTAAEAKFDLSKLETQDDHRDADLRGDKWFDTGKYPTLTFRSTVIRPLDAHNFAMSGLLTMHGVTRPVTLQGTYAGKATDPWGHVHLGYSATGTIDRNDWNVGNAPAALVGNDVTITIQAEALPR